MGKCINFELSKKLNELGLLDNIETKYWYGHSGAIFTMYQLETSTKERAKDVGIKTLTLEEAIEFLPKFIGKYHLQINFYGGIFDINYKDCWTPYYPDIEEPTLLEAIEKMITFLINDKILNPKK